ncbi:hypothetical protein IPV09_08660 [Tessaracoccus sp. SD287]|uniref:hypothetical protein n=1 Tax=Tessaracoccus sp. SD287 TaxID=2782008 RepID=UPI001A96CFF9|nr:hypothetical protein [Tessaracoccus sp. SD287]MBO1031406.1 hypothetical protein [Tessaracoccus sp. SD287]
MARTSLRNCLPEVFASACLPGSPLAALVDAADGMQRPVFDVLDDLDAHVDPFRAPPAMVAYLAAWVDLGWLTLPAAGAGSRSSLPLGSAPLRDLISASADLAATRGTAAGLVRFLELATRQTGYTVQDAGLFHVRVLVPAGAADQRETVARIVAAIKPAHVTAEVVVAQSAGPGEAAS